MELSSEVKRGVDYIGVGVGAIIVDERGRLFLARRGPKAKNERGLWEFPVEIEVGELLDVVDHILPGEGQHWVSPTFICRIASGEPVIREPDKCSDIGWFAPGQVPPDLTAISRENFENYVKLKDRTPAKDKP